MHFEYGSAIGNIAYLFHIQFVLLNIASSVHISSIENLFYYYYSDLCAIKASLNESPKKNVRDALSEFLSNYFTGARIHAIGSRAGRLSSLEADSSVRAKILARRTKTPRICAIAREGRGDRVVSERGARRRAIARDRCRPAERLARERVRDVARNRHDSALPRVCARAR